MEQNKFELRVVEVHNRGQGRRAVREVRASDRGIEEMTPKTVYRVIRIEKIPTKAAIILKQEMLSLGGEAAVSRNAGDFSDRETGVLLMANEKQYRRLCRKLKTQPFGLKRLAEQVAELLHFLEPRPPRPLRCRDLTLTLGERTLVMGVLNVTPDSFSDGGEWFDPEVAVAHAHQMVEEGADIIDVGGESTRPVTWDQPALPAEEEIKRVVPIIRRLAAELTVPISVDTYKAVTAEAALEAGAHMVNDIWGFQREPEIAKVAARYGAAVVLMHNQEGTEYEDMMAEIFAFLRKSVDLAEKAGVRPEQIVLDPGIGFGKTREQNLVVLRRLGEFRSLGYPLLLGTSRKSVIGKTLNLPPKERLEGTIATNVWGIEQGADIIRVHDVKELVRAARMTDAILTAEDEDNDN